ncbi:MAG: TfoX/Sxy family protein [Firmicutes bacterium]|nr:TfoX/Sxy family protein [Bacillota bacterium]
MNKLVNMPNIGNVLAQKLTEAGISNSDILQEIGSKKAFLKIKTMDNSACYNMLCALEGAIQGLRWHHLPEGTKQDLKEFYQSLIK